MKRILVLSDSHSGMSFMRHCVDTLKPDAIIHLGDYYEDAAELQEEYRHIPVHAVAGNCDRWRTPPSVREILIDRILGVDLYLTHGHRHGVKMTTAALVSDARKARVQAVLYGHTHMADCHQEGGLWVLNPGAGGSWGGSAGILDVENGKIMDCRIYRYGDEEEMK